MSPTRLLGALAFAIGGGLLLSEWLIGQRFLLDLVGPHLAWLRLVCVAISVLGALAVRLSVREEREYFIRKKEALDEEQSGIDRSGGPDVTRGLCAVDHVQQ